MVRIQKAVDAPTQRIITPLCWLCSVTCQPLQNVWKIKWCNRQCIEKSTKLKANQRRRHLKLVCWKTLRNLFSLRLSISPEHWLPALTLWDKCPSFLSISWRLEYAFLCSMHVFLWIPLHETKYLKKPLQSTHLLLEAVGLLKLTKFHFQR